MYKKLPTTNVLDFPLPHSRHPHFENTPPLSCGKLLVAHVRHESSRTHLDEGGEGGRKRGGGEMG